MKKKEAVYGLFEGCIVFLWRCSLMNFCSSSSSDWDSQMSLAGSELGAPSFSSMAWSQMCADGNSCDAVLLKTQAYFRY